MLTKNCLQCGKEFTVSPSQTKKFCCHKCSVLFRTGKPEKPRTTKTCPICGTEFGGNHTEKYTSKRKYCSNECAGIASRGRRRIEFEQRSCDYCGNPIPIGKSITETLEKRFCSRECSNKSRTKPDLTCVVCGKPFKRQSWGKKGVKQTCSDECLHVLRIQKKFSPSNKHPEEMRQIIRDNYPDAPISEIALKTGLTIRAIRMLAQKLGVKRSEEALKTLQEQNSKRMTAKNPMKQSGTREKVALFWKKHPEKRAEVNRLQIASKSEEQRKRPSGLERQLWAYLDEFCVEYETQVVIKDKFIVDIRIGNLIIEADGDYWHGHPRFNPPNERQRKQQKRDASRNKYLAACGYDVVRIWESDMSRETVRAILRARDLV